MFTGHYLDPLLHWLEHQLELMASHGSDNLSAFIDSAYSEIVSVLNSGARLYVPSCRKNLFKFWWNEELTMLKQEAVDSSKLWKAVGKT